MPKVMKKQTTDTPFLRKAIPITLSVWLLSLTIYYCFNVSWLSHFSSVQPGTKQLIVETLKFHWVPVFLSQLPYVFYALILNFIAILIGNRILRYLKVDFDSNISKIIFSIPLGWSIYSIGIFYLGVSKLLYKEAIYCFIMLLGVLSILEIKRFFREWKALTIISRYKIDKTDLICLPLIIIFITLQLVMSFSPVWTIDSMVYHMALPKLHIKQHTLVHVPGFLYGTLPAHTGMLYLLGLITSSEILSKLFSLSISLMFLISTFSIGNRYFSREVGYLAAIITMLSIPLFPCYFSQPFADASFGLFSLLGIYAFFMWIEEKKDGSLYLSIFCCASAAATKIQGLFFVLLFFAGFLVYASGRLKMNRQFRAKDGANLRILRKLAWFILVVGIIALPWYVRSWWLTGDPVFPFLYDYLGASASGEWNKYSNMCLWEFYSGHGFKGARSFSDIIRIAKALFFTGNINNSFSPIIFVFLIPALITLRNWSKLIKYLFFITLVYYIFFTITSPQSRFFYVGLAMLGIIVAYFIKTVWTKYLLIRIPIILCIVALFITSFSASVKWIGGPFFAGLGVLDQGKFLSNICHHYRVSTWVNKNLPQDSKMLLWYLHGYHLEREYMLVSPVYQGVLDFGRINDAPTFLKSIKELGITHLIYQYNSNYLHWRPRKFLDKCVFELLKRGEIIPIKQIDRWGVYSAVVPPDYFVLDGNTIRFNDKSQRKYLPVGWSSPEAWGRWSVGKESLIILNFREPKDYIMLIKAKGFSVPGKQQSVKVYLDDNLLEEYTFTRPIIHFEDIEVKIPSAYIKEGNQRIRFVYSFTGSLAEHRMGTDVRQLAMGVRTIEFK